MTGAFGVAQALREACIDRSDARLLLQHMLGIGHAQLIAHDERLLDAEERVRFRELCARRAAGEPVAYLVGWREFYGRRFRVNASVLIPRPETELLVEMALARMPPEAGVLDLGTGSGNLAVTLALERPDAQVVAVDASTAALAVARDNAAALGARNVVFLAGDWFAPLASRRFAIIVSNPPYVAEDDPHLIRGDLRFEPGQALVAGGNGLAAIRTIVSGAALHLTAGGWLLFEHGFEQGESSRTLLERGRFEAVGTENDLAGLPRVSTGRKPFG